MKSTRSRQLASLVVLIAMTAVTWLIPQSPVAEAQAAVAAPTGVVAMVDTDNALQLRWDSLSPNDPDLYALRWKAAGESTQFQRVDSTEYGAAQDGKHQFTVPAAAGTVWESAGVKTVQTRQQVAELTSVQVTNGLHEDIQMTYSATDLHISWAPNSFIEDAVQRTVIWHRPAGSSSAGTFVNLGLDAAENAGRYEVSVPGIGDGDEVQLRVVYVNLGQTARSEAIVPTPAPPEPLQPITEFAEDFWNLDFDPSTSNGGRAILVAGDTVYVGGDFNTISKNGATQSRNHLAAFNRITGEPTTFNANLAGSNNPVVHALALSSDGQTLFVGGKFDTAGGVARPNFAAFDVASGNLTNFNPAPNSAVRAIEVLGNQLFIGGTFTKVDGVTRQRLASYDMNGQNGQLSTAWTPQANQDIKAIVADDNGRLWVGGDFTNIDGISAAKHLAVLNAGTGTIVFDVQNPVYQTGAAVPVVALAQNNGRVFVAGGGPGGTGYGYDISGNQLWAVYSDGNYQAVDAIGDHVYFGGHYGMFRFPLQEDVDRLSRHDAATGTWDQSWTPFIGSARGINAIDVQEHGLYVAGQFFQVKTSDAANPPRQKGWAVFAGSPT